MKTGDLVLIAYEGRKVPGRIVLASQNEASLMLEFEAILGGCVGMMPVLRDEEGTYRDLINHRPVEIEPRTITEEG